MGGDKPIFWVVEGGSPPTRGNPGKYAAVWKFFVLDFKEESLDLNDVKFEANI